MVASGKPEGEGSFVLRSGRHLAVSEEEEEREYVITRTASPQGPIGRSEDDGSTTGSRTTTVRCADRKGAREPSAGTRGPLEKT